MNEPEEKLTIELKILSVVFFFIVGLLLVLFILFLLVAIKFLAGLL